MPGPSQRVVRGVTHPVLPAWPQDPARQPQISPGALVGGRYEIIELLGEGGMGRVYKAYDPAMDRYVAIKVLKGDVPAIERERFRREAYLGAQFCHLNLVPVLDRGEFSEGEGEWMAMLYLRGQDVRELLDTRGPVAPHILIDVASQALEGLEYIHRRQIVHCDVKPDNLFITRDPYDRRIVVVKLIDFGIHRDLRPPLELRTHLSGDPRYMSPEQAIINGPLDGRADLYSLGIGLYEALTGHHPFQSLLDTKLERLLMAHAYDTPPPPSHVMPPGIPRGFAEAFDGFFARASAKDPADRFSSALEMKQALTGLARLARFPRAA